MMPYQALSGLRRVVLQRHVVFPACLHTNPLDNPTEKTQFRSAHTKGPRKFSSDKKGMTKIGDNSTETTSTTISSMKQSGKRTSQGFKTLLEAMSPRPGNAYINSRTRAEQTPKEIDIGAEMVGPLDRNKLVEVLGNFKSMPYFYEMCQQLGLDDNLSNRAFMDFRKMILMSSKIPLPPELHVKLHDITNSAAHESDLFPYFTNHVHKLYPHIKNMDELKHISNLTDPVNWYPEARAMKRKIIYHAGPTNSGKTYNALNALFDSQNGIYCGPLKLLAAEVAFKCNAKGVPCDMITGEERKLANPDGITPSSHTSSTIEMVDFSKEYDVAVIDEIQMIGNEGRGSAWTRTLLGLKAKEIHLCGDATAIDLITELANHTGDEFEIKTYKRLTELFLQDEAIDSIENIKRGDCIVCFNKLDIYDVTKRLVAAGYSVANIYGSMPPAVKLEQATRFNDPNDKCKVLVATDAIGMGVNLSIGRVVFNSLEKPVRLKTDATSFEMPDQPDKNFISTSQVLQIGGRAGRFNTEYSTGYVTSFNKSDLSNLHVIYNAKMENLAKAGLQPTIEQLEAFSYHLPDLQLHKLFEIFLSTCSLNNSQYFMCNMDAMKKIAEELAEIKMPLRSLYTFVQAPVNFKESFVLSVFKSFASFYAEGAAVTHIWLQSKLEWPPKIPHDVMDIRRLETHFDILELYLWLGVRFPSTFGYTEQIYAMKSKLEKVIAYGVIINASGNNQTIISKMKWCEQENIMPNGKIIDDETSFKEQIEMLDSSKSKEQESRMLIQNFLDTGVWSHDKLQMLIDEATKRLPRDKRQ